MTRDELDAEIAEKTEDLRVFAQAVDLMRSRVVFIADNSKSPMPLHTWSGATGLIDIGSVILHNMEKVLEELKEARASIPPVVLRIIQGEANGHQASE